ncbi:PAS domain-containing sensor histidine kinase [Methanospirillum hungatei]|uniref:sensor histidine kinase n=1 Tax=Methanospirillum hungatei TaxID=2203 RepID=UPI0026F25A9E|nr:PAS domain-containing sensor histidine kinase [Methanospirillum hungatei]MCA1916561.1 PAS domain-containing sensor histidine kinase [Methanospirillum hungatei]
MTSDYASIISQSLNTLPVGICIIREDHTITFWNRTIETWTGISQIQAEGKILEDVVPVFGEHHERSRLKVVFKGGGPVILSSRFHPRIFPLRENSQNEGKYQRITISPFILPDEGAQAIITVEDVTAITEQVFRYRQIKDQIAFELEEKKITERALEMALSKLNNLASITRHDLLNSLTVFEGYLGILLNQEPGGKIQTYLEKMRESTLSMKRHITFARDYQEMGNAAPTWYHVESLVKNSGTGPIFRDITIEANTGNLEILADPLIIKAMYNLLENAVRHGEHTSHITVSHVKGPDSVTIILEDNGVGVPSDKKGRIFNKGFGSNTGLGLFLTREILGITGMQIIETGTPGKGARFEIRVPAGHFRYPGEE